MKCTKIILPVILTCVVIVATLAVCFWAINPLSGGESYAISEKTPAGSPVVDELDSLSSALDNAESDIRRLKKQIGINISGYEFLDQGIGTPIFRIVKGYNDTKKEGKISDFLSLSYLGLKNGDTPHPKYKFFTEKGIGYLSSLLGSIKRDSNEHLYHYSNFKKVDYLYSNDERSKGILIPLQSKAQITLYKVSVWLLALLFLFAFAFVLVNSIAVLFNISRNNAFAPINIFRLKWCSITLLVMLAVPYLTTAVLYLIYFNRLSPEVTFTHSFFDSDYQTMIVGFVYWLLFLAFRKGYQLQQENELTV